MLHPCKTPSVLHDHEGYQTQVIMHAFVFSSWVFLFIVPYPLIEHTNGGYIVLVGVDGYLLGVLHVEFALVHVLASPRCLAQIPLTSPAVRDRQ